jgi:hypothetical protein
MEAEPGADGDMGPPGRIGVDGAAGATGATGPTGPQGLPGPALFILDEPESPEIPMAPPGSPGANGMAYKLVATLGSDATTGANTTPITLTNLVWTYETNSVYFFRFIGEINSAAATTGCGFQLDVSSAITEIAMSFYHQLANTGTLSSGSSNADDASLGVSSGVPTLATNVPVIGDGMLRTGANTGTAQLRYRSETTAATTCKAGMTLVVEKVA